MDYKVKDPNGVEHIISGPEGATPEEVIAQAQKIVPFKQQQPEEPGLLHRMVAIEEQPGLPKSPTEFIQQTGRQFKDALTSPMPGSMLTAPLRAVQETAQQAGADVAKATVPTLGGFVGRTLGFGTSAALDPTSYIAPGLAKGPQIAESTPQKMMKPGIDEMLNNLKTESGPIKEAIESHTAKIMDTLDSTVKEYGDKLNQAKKNLGLPISLAEREQGIAQVGNPHGLDIGNIAVQKYKKFIDEPKNATDLVSKISEFKQESSKINDPRLKVQLALSLQDKINDFVDWDKTGNTTEGVLKSQFNDLRRLAIPDSLKESKKMMADALDLSNQLASKLEEPGKAEAFLRNVITGKSARNKDYITSLRHLEELSDKKFFDDIKVAVEKDKATDLIIKKLEKAKKPDMPEPSEQGITIKDLLMFKAMTWHALAVKIIEYRKQLGSAAKTTGKASGLIGLNKLGEGLNGKKLQSLRDRLYNNAQ